MNNLNIKIKEARKHNGLTQEQLANLIGVTRQSVVGWENGSTVPSGENLEALNHLFKRQLSPSLEQRAVELLGQLRQIHQQHNEVIGELEALVGGV